MEEMARISFQDLSPLSRPAGHPVEWVDRYSVSTQCRQKSRHSPARPIRWVRRVSRPNRRSRAGLGAICPPEATPFPARTGAAHLHHDVQHRRYGHTLDERFSSPPAESFVRSEFHSLADVAHLKEKVVN